MGNKLKFTVKESPELVLGSRTINRNPEVGEEELKPVIEQGLPRNFLALKLIPKSLVEGVIVINACRSEWKLALGTKLNQGIFFVGVGI